MTRLRAALVALALVAATLLGITATAGSASATYAGHDGKIAFVRANQIYTMSSIGTSVTKLTSSGKNYRPHWSPDGKRIAYINETAGGAKNVWVMSATGGSKQRVTTTGDVTSAGAAWAPNGARLAFAKLGSDGWQNTLYTVKATAPFGTPAEAMGTYSDPDVFEGVKAIPVDTYVAWSAGNVIAVLNAEDWNLDHAIWMYHPSTGAVTEYDATGGDCCGYLEWKDLFWGPTNTFGLSQRDLGDELQSPDAPSRVVYGAFPSVDGDAGGAPSPSGAYVAVTNASSGTATVFRVNIDGTGRRALAAGYQPDWQRVS